MEAGCSGAQKRKVEQLDSDSEAYTNAIGKRKCVDPREICAENLENPYQSLMCLPDDVLYIILSNLHPKDRLEIGLTCRRMLNLVSSPGVWRNADCRPLHVNNSMFKKLIKFLSIGTHSLSIRGYSMKHLHADIEPTCTSQLMQELKQKCTKIKIMRVEEDLIHQIGIKDFPSTLEELSLAGSANRYFQSENSVPYFFRIEKLLPNLTTLCLRQCRWFEPHALMILSKLPNLRNLDVSKCTRLAECVPYFSLAMRHGFKKLQILDLRDTLLGDSEISCLKSLPCLTELLLQCPSNTEDENPVQHVEPEQNPVVLIRPFDGFYNPPRRMFRQVEDGVIFLNEAHNFRNNLNQQEDNNRPFEQRHELVIHINRPLPNPLPPNPQPPNEPPLNEHVAGPNDEAQPEQRAEVGDGFRGVGIRYNIAWRIDNNDMGAVGAIHIPPLPTRCLISDRAICGFGSSNVNNEFNLIRIQGEHAAEEYEPLLERIILRNYILITDRSLRHLTNATPHLKFLDVSGTRVTEDGVNKFKHDRPDCVVLSDFDC